MEEDSVTSSRPPGVRHLVRRSQSAHQLVSDNTAVVSDTGLWSSLLTSRSNARCQTPAGCQTPIDGRSQTPDVPPRSLRDRGQATTEYALVLLAAALVGLLVVGWATSGGGAAAVGKLFERVIDSVIDKV